MTEGKLTQKEACVGQGVGTTDRFNNAKRAEEKDRIKHGV